MQEHESKLKRWMTDEIDIEIDDDDLKHESVLDEFRKQKKRTTFWICVWVYGWGLFGISAILFKTYILEDKTYNEIWALLIILNSLGGYIRYYITIAKLSVQKELKLIQIQIADLAGKLEK
ncbi:hypothetical protein KS4_20110 [Poriferisphaera corsica]|uniref:Uncharacterized protein n=1 Tax=Poriferisphaera corsica TaxID=2528020 RepID=A0A517YUP2_9BACT|nr:hypothetical protein [Poriferisphaera corsica]QDU33951.1 hypothetical protein KS4_20110 [Poriferisphaera corsica]